MAQVTSIALDRRCCELVRTILNAPDIDVRHCDQILKLLAEHQATAVDRVLEGNRAEFITSRQALHDLQHRTGSFDPKLMQDIWGLNGDVTSPLACVNIFVDLRGFGPMEHAQKMAKVAARFQDALLPGAWQGGKMLSDENYAKEVDTLNRFYGSILDLATQPGFRRSRDVEAAIAPLAAPLRETTLAVFLVPGEEGTIWGIRRCETRLRGTQCLVALRRWQLQRTDTPPDLETLVKAAGMPRVPTDLFSNQPLRLGSVSGKPVIYSIGPDGKDDKAQVEWNFGPKRPGDFIFRLAELPDL